MFKPTKKFGHKYGSKNIHLEFTAFGKWDKAVHNLSILPKTIQRSLLDIQEKTAKKYARIVKDHIYAQDLESLGGNPKRKPEYAGDSRTLIDTATYVESITSWRKDNVYYAGVKPGITNPEGVSIARIAYWLETGTRKMIARPVWGPSLIEMGGKKGMEKAVKDRLTQKFRMEGIPYDGN